MFGEDYRQAEPYVLFGMIQDFIQAFKVTYQQHVVQIYSGIKQMVECSTKLLHIGTLMKQLCKYMQKNVICG